MSAGLGVSAGLAPARARPRERFAVALDLPSVDEARAMVERLGDAATVHKVGLELAVVGGLPFAAALAREGFDVFLDLKLHDIPHTVERAVRGVAGLGARLLTVHAYPQTMAAAVAGRGAAGLLLLGVSALTSMDDADLALAGYALTAAELVARRARQAVDLGMDGLVCSPREAAAVRAVVGDALLLVTPGVRPAGGDPGDQKRAATPAEAIRAGADLLVVGRPLTRAPDPRAAALALRAEIAAA